MTTVESSSPTPPVSRGRRGLRAVAKGLQLLFGSESRLQSTVKEPTHSLQPGLSALELATLIRQRFYEDKQWARDRRSVWSARSTLLRFLIFTLSILAIVFLGIASLDGFAIVGFICTAAGTAVAALESFFNWRARWVAADAALAEWHEIEESLALYVASRSEDELEVDALVEFDGERRASWRKLSQTWLTERDNGSSLSSDG